MQICRMLCVAILMLAIPAGAQVEIFCQPLHSHFLIGEQTTVQVEVRNNTGGTLIIAGTNRNAKLSFELVTDSGASVPTRTELALAPNDVIRNGQPWVRSIDLNAFYDLRNPGQLRIRAYIEWEGNAYLSAKAFMGIERGKEVGKLIAADGTDKNKTTVRYSLRTVAREEGEILFLCLEDPDTQLRLACANLGTMVRLYPAVLRRDAAGHLHILHQSAPNRFTHSELTATGRLLSQEHFATDYQMPDMQELDGHIVVRGQPYIPGDDRRMPLGPDSQR